MKIIILTECIYVSNDFVWPIFEWETTKVRTNFISPESSCREGKNLDRGECFERFEFDLQHLFCRSIENCNYKSNHHHDELRKQQSYL